MSVSVHWRVCGRTSVRMSDAITRQRPLPHCPRVPHTHCTFSTQASGHDHCEGRVCAPEADDLANAGKDGHELFLGRIVRNVTDCVREWVLSGVCVVWCARERVTRWCKWVASVETGASKEMQQCLPEHRHNYSGGATTAGNAEQGRRVGECCVCPRWVWNQGGVCASSTSLRRQVRP